MADSADASDLESGGGGGIVQNDASDSEPSRDSASEDDRKGFFDLEASESGDNSDSDDGSSDSASYGFSMRADGSSSRRRGPKVSFPQFSRLPIELRHRIWEFFCPDLAPLPRVLSFQLVCNPVQDMVWEGPVLDHQMAPANALLAVNRESRGLALRAYPDKLSIREGRRVVRFNRARDVVHIAGHRRSWQHNVRIRGFTNRIANLALEPVDFEVEMPQLKHFTNLRHFFFLEWHNDGEGRVPRELRWCASDKVAHYEVLQLQKDVGFGEDLHFIYCFPDLDKNIEFARRKASANAEAYEALDEVEENLELEPDEPGLSELRKVQYWSMACFGWDAADKFEAFRAKYAGGAGDEAGEGGDSDDDGEGGSDENDDDSDVNEYESDGIDDAPIEEASFNDEDEDDLLVFGGEQSEDDEEERGSSDLSASSPIENYASTVVDGRLAAPIPANFSSPEPESEGGGGQDGPIVLSDDEDEPRPGNQARRAHRRTEIVVLSDDEDQEENPPSQSTTRRSRVVLSDDDEEEEEEEEEEEAKPARPAIRRRRRILPSDDEDEDEDADASGAGFGNAQTGNTEAQNASDPETDPANPKKPLSLAEKLARNRRQNPISDEEEGEGSDSDSDSDSEEEDPRLKKKMSLIERLTAPRRGRNPVISARDGFDGSVGGEDDDLQDDDDDDDDDEDDDENGMFATMAEEGESDEEGGDDDDDDEY